MANLSIRGLDNETLEKLKHDAHTQGTSINRRIIELLQEQMGTVQKHQRQRIHHDLDKLAGTWSDQDAKEFSEAIVPFSEIDETLWQ